MTIFNFAAIRIQSTIRSYLVRLRLNKPSFAVQAAERTTKRRRNNQLLNKYLLFMQSCSQSKCPDWLHGGYSEYCAVKMQSILRMRCVKRRVNMRRSFIFQLASVVIQMKYRRYKRIEKRQLSSLEIIQEESNQEETLQEVKEVKKSNSIDARFVRWAFMIQNCWRSFCNKRIYNYYRTLVIAKLNGAPADLLRNIVPREVDLLDNASGIHIRFRLGGISFPPKIYFKVFTHRPLCDIGAFAPRNYLKDTPQVYDSLRQTNKIKLRVGAKEFSGILNVGLKTNFNDWYTREDANNWRPIAFETIYNALEPPGKLTARKEGSKCGSTSRSYYQDLIQNHSRFVMKKRRQIEWRKKAYLLRKEEEEFGREFKEITSRSMSDEDRVLDWR